MYSRTRGSAVFLVRPHVFVVYANKTMVILFEFQSDNRRLWSYQFRMASHEYQ